MYVNVNQLNKTFDENPEYILQLLSDEDINFLDFLFYTILKKSDYKLAYDYIMNILKYMNDSLNDTYIKIFNTLLKSITNSNVKILWNKCIIY